MLRRYQRDIPVLFLDTVHHFDETCRYRDEIAAAWGLNLVTLRAAEPAPGLWRESTQACCGRHKVDPLFAALANYDTSGSPDCGAISPRRAPGCRRSSRSAVGEGATLQKISPLARWTTADVRAYASAHAIPLLPLYERGYTSIGCEPCTSLPLDPGNERSGRWAGQKLECGIHLRRSS